MFKPHTPYSECERFLLNREHAKYYIQPFISHNGYIQKCLDEAVVSVKTSVKSYLIDVKCQYN